MSAWPQGETRGAAIYDRKDSEHGKATKRKECVTVLLLPSVHDKTLQDDVPTGRTFPMASSGNESSCPALAG